MSKLCRIINLKVLPTFLAAVLIFNAAAPSYAQLLPTVNKEQDEKVGSVLQQKYEAVEYGWKTDFFKDIDTMNKAVARAKEIREKLKPADSERPQAPEEPKPLTRQEFTNKYNKETAAAYAAVSAKFLAEKQKAEAAIAMAALDEAALLEQKAALSDWEATNTKALQGWKAGIAADEPNAYKRYLSAFEEALKEAKTEQEAEIEKYVKGLMQELMAIYKKYPGPETERVLLDVSPAVLMLKDGKTDFFTAADKTILKNIYLKYLRTSNSCDIIVTKKTTTYTTVLSPTVGSVSIPSTHKEYGVRSKEGCDALLNAVVGMGLLGDSRADGLAVVEFMEKNAKTGISVPSMLMGASALMAMNEYGALRGFVASAVAKENHDISSFPTFTDLVDIIAYNRTYLGEVSQYTKYPIGGGAMGNGWEDLAYLLAENNTPESLEILQFFAINCSVFPGDRFTADRLTCNGIRPFLLGAVLSGKIDFKNYQIANIAEESRNYLTADGRNIYQSDEQIQKSKNYNAWARSNFNKYVSNLGVSKGAALAKWLYDSDMGDIDVDSKMAVDQKIYAKYGKELASGNNAAIENYTKGSRL